MIRLTVPSIDEQDLAAVASVLRSGFLVQGKTVAAFEQELAGHVGCKHVVAVSNCTAALHLSLLALGVGAGDEVAVSAYSWIATANVIELVGAKPLFVDVREDTFNLDPARLQAVLSEHRGRVKAILPVHTFGQTADMLAIMRIAAEHDIPVIEDAACALGAELSAKPAGSFGKLACFSFHPRKAITTGEGGAVTTDDAALARTLRILRNHGQDPDAPEFVAAGFNYRLTEFQAALGLTQLAKLDRIIGKRRELAQTYNRLFEGTAVRAPAVHADARHVYQSYVVTLPAALREKQREVIAALKDKGIETTIGTCHMPMTSYFRSRYGFKKGDFPICDRVAAGALTLPLHESLTDAEQKHVVDSLLALASKH